jgi:hypothetical protein
MPGSIDVAHYLVSLSDQSLVMQLGRNVDASRFGHAESGFQVLDLNAEFAFRSQTSISFNLGRYSDTLTLPGGGLLANDFVLPVGLGGVFNVVGRVDVHHPCEGHIKAQLRTVLPSDYQQFERMRDFVAILFRALAIPPDETFEAHFVSAEQQTLYENATDRDGMTDRI